MGTAMGSQGMSGTPGERESWLNAIAYELDEHAATCTMQHFARAYRAGASRLRWEATR